MSKIAGQSARPISGEPFDGTGLREKAGIVSGRLVEWAEAFECEPDDILRVIGFAYDIEPVMDTAQEKPRESHDRPTDPSRRSIALTRGDVGILTAHLSMTDQQ